MIAPVFATERLVLRPLQPADAAGLYALFSDDRVTEHYDLASLRSLSEAISLLQHFLNGNANPVASGFRWAITRKGQPEQLLGTCGVHSPNAAFHSIAIGYDLLPDVWGQGLAREAVSGMLDYCFSSHFPFELNRVTATTDLVSPRSIALLQRLGFSEEGILRQFGYWKEAFHDVRLFALLRQDWECQQSV